MASIESDQDRHEHEVDSELWWEQQDKDKAWAEKMILPVDYTMLLPEGRKAIRERYIVEQSGLCYYCKSALNKPPPSQITDKKVTKKPYPKNFFKWPVHLHHDHNTGMTIGSVHSYCNAVLWEYENE